MHIPATLDQARCILAIMLRVAAAEGPPTEADKESIAAATRYIFQLEPQFGLAGLMPLSPSRISALATDRDLARQAVSFATIIALLDGTINVEKLHAVIKLAGTLNVHDEFVDDLARLASGKLSDAIDHMTLAKIESVTGRKWATAEADAWLRPYNAEPDPALATRFHALARLPGDTFGYAFAAFYDENNYAYPGEPTALNFALSVPHDSVHVLAGYDTSPRGELLTSAMSATMHRNQGMSGHVLPAILSGHLGIPIDDAAGAATGALDPQEFWYAWARGEDTAADLFGPDWNFWSAAIQPIAAVRDVVGLIPA